MRPDDSVSTLLRSAGYRAIGQLRTRSARDIASSPWSIGCETLDRDYVDPTQSLPHLAELGAKQVRLQGGFAKCDPGTGQFNWKWLDEIVDACIAAGAKPWIETSYGNPAYPGGGGIGLADGIPTSEAALGAWDRWVRALVERYGDRVDSWEIWNEPDIHNAVEPCAYAEFFIRTASIIRRVQPHACIIGLALAHKVDFAQAFLEQLQAAGKTDLLSEITFHGYPHNPDDGFTTTVPQLRELCARYAPHVTLRQGETGAPSETPEVGALRDLPWNERKQAVWDLRRMLAHHARGIPMNLFQLADMHYTRALGAKFEGRNAKGLLQMNRDRSFACRKPSYFAAQHVFTMFDGSVSLEELPNLAESEARRTCAFAWRRAGEPEPCMVGWWRASDPPGLEAPALEQLQLPAAAKLRDPVLVDLLGGAIFSPPADLAILPCTDSPLLLAESRVLP